MIHKSCIKGPEFRELLILPWKAKSRWARSRSPRTAVLAEDFQGLGLRVSRRIPESWNMGFGGLVLLLMIKILHYLKDPTL